MIESEFLLYVGGMSIQEFEFQVILGTFSREKIKREDKRRKREEKEGKKGDMGGIKRKFSWKSYARVLLTIIYSTATVRQHIK